MTNTYDMSNFLPCPFCGAKPEAMDWHAGPRARIFVDCPNGNYDDEHGGCSVGPQVVGSDMEDADARWNRRATGPDASGLVQVLESIVEYYPHPDIDHERFRVLACRFARQALSEYRESTRVQHAANRDQLHQMAFEYGGDEAGQGYMVTVEEFDAILDRAMQPATAQVPEFRSSKDGEHWPRTGDKYLVKLNGVLQEEIFEFDQGDDGMGGGDYFWSRDDIDECPPFMPDSDEWLPLSALLAASPAPEHSGDGNEMVPALRQYRHNYGGGFVFAYDKEQTDRIVTGLVKALEPFAKCARELDGSPEDDIDPADDDEWAKFRLLVSDYRRARAALAAYRKQGSE